MVVSVNFYSWHRRDGYWIDNQPMICSAVCLTTSKKSVYEAPTNTYWALRLWRDWPHSLMSTTANLERKCWRFWLTERRCSGNVLWSKEPKGKVEVAGPGSFMARKHHLGSRARQEGEGVPQASSWHSAPNYDSRIISFDSVRKEHIKARILWIKMLTNRANYSSVIWIFTQWAWVLMKACSRAGGGFDDEAAVYVSDLVLPTLARESVLECLLPTQRSHEFYSSFLESWSKLRWGGDYRDVGN